MTSTECWELASHPLLKIYTPECIQYDKKFFLASERGLFGGGIVLGFIYACFVIVSKQTRHSLNFLFCIQVSFLQSLDHRLCHKAQISSISWYNAAMIKWCIHSNRLIDLLANSEVSISVSADKNLQPAIHVPGIYRQKTKPGIQSGNWLIIQTINKSENRKQS